MSADARAELTIDRLAVAGCSSRTERYIDRELSWLDFSARVLALAVDPAQPLLERAKFLAIFSQILDEFFQVRVSGLLSRMEAGLGAGADAGTPGEQLTDIRSTVTRLVDCQTRLFADDIQPSLAAVGVGLSTWEELGAEDRAHLVRVFQDQIFPVLTPLAVDPGHPFPYISNLSLNLAVIVVDPETGARRFARVKVPPLLPRFIALSDGERFVPLEQVIAAHLHTLFPGLEVESHYPFRVTRNVDLTPQEDEEADDLLAAVEMELRRRRFGEAVRLEVDDAITDEILDLLLREIGIREQQVYRVAGPLDLGGLWSVYGLDRPDLKEEPWPAVTPPALERPDGEPADFFAVLDASDVLVHHPYDSFATTVEEFIRQAAADPGVLAIKLTLYRTSGDSPIIKALIRAAERGKQVAALVEVKARFDEQANIAWARALEEAGVHVVYELPGLKTHSKIALVVRQGGDGAVRRYCHIGTGNYNPATARIYEDLGLLTSNEGLGADLTDLFNFLTGYSRRVSYRHILVAPMTLRSAVLDLIAEQAALGQRGRIVMKVNHLVDQEIIDALYRASRAGVSIDLVVRTTCGLRPGLPGHSDRITVRSIVGRYLEHSRIMAFGDGSTGPIRYFIGSADLMERNLDRRVEAVVPVEEPELAERLQQILDVCLADDVQAWTLDGTGRWTKVPTTEGVATQATLAGLAATRSRRRGDVEGLVEQRAG